MADSQEEYNTNIIHESLGDTTNFWGDYTLGELILFLIPPFGFLIAMGMPFVPAALFFPTLALAVAVEVFLYILHKVRPEHYRLTEWLQVKLFWLVKKRQYTHGQGNQDTRQVTRLERIMPHGVERVDGAYVGAVEVEPANMALQDNEKWRKAVKSLTRLSESLTGRAKLHVTTAEVDKESHIQAHIDRLEDPDAQSHSIFRGVLTEFVNRYTDDNGSVETETEIQRKYYIIVWVTDKDIHDLQMTSDSIADYMTGIPVIGRLFTRFDSDTLTDAEREEFKAKKLHDRLQTVDRAVNNMFRCRSRSVSPHELAHLTEDYWACETRSEREYGEATSISPVTYSARELIKHGKGAATHDAAEGFDTDDVGGTDYEVDETDFVSQLHRPGENHRSLVAPTDIEWEADHALIDQETYTRCFWIETYPEHPTSGMLEQLLLDTELAVDVSIQIDPYGSDAAVSVMEEWISSLKMLQNDKGELEAEDIEQDVNQAKYIRQMVRRNHTSLFRVGAFIRLTAETEEDLRKQTNRLETLLRDSPSNCAVKRTTRRQEAGLVTVSPIGANELGQNRLSSMTGEALGALFPFSSNYMRMDDGIEYGLHGHNDSSLLIDPWELETGHSELVTGMPGGGKTHGTQARAMRMLKKRSDVKQIYVDPVGDMHGSAKMLDAKTITISGETPLNPCEMHPTPEHVLEQSPDMQPVSAKKDEVYGVIENFLQSRDVDLEMHSGLITFLIDTIFAESDINPADPSTHTPENSPDLSDFLEVVDRLQADPGMFPGATTESSQEKIQQYANELSIALHPFRPGSTFGNLSKESDLRLIEDSSKAVYLDLQQVEGSGSGLGKQSFIMQLLLSTLYQQAKNMEQKVEIIIDEAHYLFNDDANLESLNQIARHQRHAGLRLVMLSQTLSEFEDKGAAEEIAGMCPIKVHHREPELGDGTAESAGLTDEQQSYIQHAEAGKESLGDGQGYSQALVRVDEHGDYPLTIKTSWEEKQIIDLDADAEDTLDIVAHEVDSHVADFEEFVRSQVAEQELTSQGLSPETAEHVLNDLSEEELVDVVSVALDQAQPDAVVADGGIETQENSEFDTTE